MSTIVHFGGGIEVPAELKMRLSEALFEVTSSLTDSQFEEAFIPEKCAATVARTSLQAA